MQNSNQAIDHQLQQTGLYTMVIAEAGNDAQATYNLSLVKIPSQLRPGIYNPIPSNGSAVYSPDDSFGWNSVVGATGYDLYFGEDVITPLVKIGDNLPSNSMPFPQMECGKIYYWHVVDHTSGGDIQGPYWWFKADIYGDELAVDFGDSGLWHYDGTTWSKKTSWDAENLTDVDLY